MLDGRLIHSVIGRQFVLVDFGFSLGPDETDELAQRGFMQLAHRHGLTVVLGTGGGTILQPDRHPLPELTRDR